MNADVLKEESLKKELARLSPEGALVVNTAPFTGRSTNERFIVKAGNAAEQVDWGKINQPIETSQAETYFSGLEQSVSAVEHYTVDAYAGPYPVQVKSTSPWHAAFAENMFRQQVIDSVKAEIDDLSPITVWHSPYGNPKKFLPDWPYDCAIVVDFDRRRVGICGTAYAGEIKKSVFTICNYHLPAEGILPMHSSANCLADGSNSSVLFGLSGTGKTTLSAAADRFLVGDDEIIWTNNGLSNLEGGCYAKLIKLNAKDEPQIYSAVNRPGAILENVVYNDRTQTLDFDDASITENTRGSYPIEHIENTFEQTRESQAPQSIVFLTADAFGALPAVARLDHWQAQYHFMSGYTAKVAGTEKGVTEPQATFSACFGAPFMPRVASVYAKMLVEKARQYNCQIWLLNTGWMAGGYGHSERYPIPVSRQLLSMIQDGSLNQVEMVRHPVFGFDVPKAVSGIDAKYLSIPEGPIVKQLAEQFRQNFRKYKDSHSEQIGINGGPAPTH